MAFQSAAPSQWQTYNAGPGDGNTIREDLSDIITIMSPLDTPLLSMLPQVPVHNPYYDWPIDDIPTPDSAASSVEGADAVFSATSVQGQDTRFRMGNGTCIVTKFVDVTDSQRSALMAGVRDEFAYQVWKRTLEMAKQFEFNLHWGVYTTGDNTATPSARQTQGYIPWVFQLGDGAQSDKNVAGKLYDMSATGRQVIYQPVYFSGAGSIDRTILSSNLLTPAWRKGMQIEGAIMLCGAPVKRQIADFAIVNSTGELNTRTIPAEARRVEDTIDFIRTDYGVLYVNLDRYLDGDAARQVNVPGAGTGASAKNFSLAETALIFQPGMLENAMYRPASFTLLAKIGDATKGLCVMEGGTRPGNPISMIVGTDLSA